jgi:hypothetical protein
MTRLPCLRSQALAPATASPLALSSAADLTSEQR